MKIKKHLKTAICIKIRSTDNFYSLFCSSDLQPGPSPHYGWAGLQIGRCRIFNLVPPTHYGWEGLQIERCGISVLTIVGRVNVDEVVNLNNQCINKLNISHSNTVWSMPNLDIRITRILNMHITTGFELAVHIFPRNQLVVLFYFQKLQACWTRTPISPSSLH